MSKFCQACGHELNQEQIFCSECGVQQPSSNYQSQTIVREHRTHKKSPMSLRKKISFLLLGIVAIGLFAGHYTIQAKTSPEKKIQSFLAALKSENKNEILAQLYIPDKVLRDDEAYVNYLLSQDVDAFNRRVVEAAKGLSAQGITQEVRHENGETIITLTQEKFLGLYPVYDIGVVPFKVKVVTDIEGANFQIANQIFSLKKGENSLGDFLPGTYVGEISVNKDGYVTAHTEEMMLSGNEDYELTYNSSHLMAIINSNELSAILFIDDKSTGKTIGELSTIGPIFEGEQLVVHAEMVDKEGKKHRTPMQSVTAGDMILLRFETSDPEDAVVEEEESVVAENLVGFEEITLSEFFLNFRSAYEESLNMKDFDFVQPYFKPETIAYEEIVEFIGDIGDEYYLYDFIEDTVIEYDIQDDYAFITTYEEFDFTNHLNVVTNYKRNKKYEIHQDESGKLQIVKIDILDTQRRN